MIGLVSSALLVVNCFLCLRSVNALVSSKPGLIFKNRLDLWRCHALAEKENTKSDLDTDTLAATVSASKARVRFTGQSAVDNISLENNQIDSMLSNLTSDVGSIAIGLAGLLVLLIGPLFSDAESTTASDAESAAALGYETRSNLLALFACGSVLVNGISKLDVESVLAEPVSLVGTKYDTVQCSKQYVDEKQRLSIEWALAALITATPASSALLMQLGKDDEWKALGWTGILPQNDDNAQEVILPARTPILDRFRSDTLAESYLPTLQNLPGKTEFTYLPVNTQAVLLIPARMSTVIVLGSNQAKSFSPRDIAWCQAIGRRLSTEQAVEK